MSVISILQDLVGMLHHERNRRSDRVDDALRAINTALLETEKYIEASSGEKSADRSAEYNLASLWKEASVQCRTVQGELAEILNQKAAYWADQVAWDRSLIEEKQITLANIRKEISDILSN